MAYGARAQAELSRVREAVSWAGRALELTDEELAGAIGVSTRSIARWREASHRPNASHVLAAEHLLDLAAALAATFGSDRGAVQAWLHRPLPALRRRSPLRAIVAGDVAAVVAALASAESGSFA